jgi:hypothetical protein
MERKIYDVIAGDKVWKGIARGGERASVVTKTKEEAISKTTSIAKKNGPSQVVIRKENGKIQSERTYGNDPKISKG